MKRLLPLLFLVLSIASSAFAHVSDHPSVQDVTAGIVSRLQAALPHDSLAALRLDRAMQFVTEEDLRVLGAEFWTFDVNVPAIVTVYRYGRQSIIPFWMEEAGFEKVDGIVITGNRKEYEIWQKRVEPGHVNLGIDGFDGNSRCYFVSVGPVTEGDTLRVRNVYPGRHTATVFRQGELIYADSPYYALDQYPAELEDQVMLRGVQGLAEDTRIIHLFRVTQFPASTAPDQVTLTWSADPQTTQAVQWRTSTAVSDGVVQYRRSDAGADAPWTTVIADVAPLRDTNLLNDPICNRYSAVLRGLEPGTAYTYRVGCPSVDRWTAPAEFTTAPGQAVPFSFIYMGDVQNGIDEWESLVQQSFREYPQAAFYLLAGDQVNRGNQRDDWDMFFNSARGVFDRRPLVPLLGNHEYQGDYGPWMYLRLLTLPENGPMLVGREQAYSFEYGNALFVVLDSNQPPELQTEWLEEQLANSNATWKFVAFHHPAYWSKGTRANWEIRQLWGDIFDRYHVDMALQGHDHAYLRTWPMHGGEQVETAAEGTYYVVSNAGRKFYEQDPHDYTAVGLTNLSMYQVLDIRIEGNRLLYRAYDEQGNLRDELVIEK